MRKHLPNTSTGFTLIELLVVITILAVLGTISIAVFGNAQKNSRDGKTKADIVAIGRSIESARTIANDGSITYTYNATTTDSSSLNNDFKTTPTGIKYAYCIKSADSAVADPDISTATLQATWTSSACPAGYGVFGTAGSPSNNKNWKVCGRLESSATAINCVASISQ